MDNLKVGDFVNENEVIDKYLFNGEIPVLETTGDETNAKCMCEGDIKTILTHEQYERNCYRLEEEYWKQNCDLNVCISKAYIFLTNWLLENYGGY